MIGSKLNVIQLQQRLRYSVTAWLFWLVLVEPAVKLKDLSLSAVLGQTILAILPLLLLLPILYKGKHGKGLIFASLVVMLYLGVASMAMFKGWLACALYGIEALLILMVLFFMMWLVERLPKLN